MSQDKHALTEQAARLYPRNPALQAEWIRAVSTVRKTSQGWVLDRPIRKAVQQ